MSSRTFPLILALLVLHVTILYGQERVGDISDKIMKDMPGAGHKHNHSKNPKVAPGDGTGPVGVTEKLGGKIPLDAVFTDEKGNPLELRRYIDRPTIILPIFYSCPNVCGIMLGSLSVALQKVSLAPGKEFKVIALSFDDEEGPPFALRAKEDYLKTNKRKNLPENWKFLTGKKKSIKDFTDSIGFHYVKTGRHAFTHPNVLVAIAADGTIIRYLYGPNFLPFDISMALTEAEKGTPVVSVRKILSLCFDYNQSKKRYSFRFVRILTIGIVLVLGLFMFFLLRGKKAADTRG